MFQVISEDCMAICGWELEQRHSKSCVFGTNIAYGCMWMHTDAYGCMLDIYIRLLQDDAVRQGALCSMYVCMYIHIEKREVANCRMCVASQCSNGRFDSAGLAGTG